MRDGAVSERDYRASSPSIVVILKEVNDPRRNKGWDLRQFLREGGRPQAIIVTVHSGDAGNELNDHCLGR